MSPSLVLHPKKICNNMSTYNTLTTNIRKRILKNKPKKTSEAWTTWAPNDSTNTDRCMIHTYATVSPNFRLCLFLVDPKMGPCQPYKQKIKFFDLKIKNQKKSIKTKQQQTCNRCFNNNNVLAILCNWTQVDCIAHVLLDG